MTDDSETLSGGTLRTCMTDGGDNMPRAVCGDWLEVGADKRHAGMVRMVLGKVKGYEEEEKGIFAPGRNTV